MEGVREKAEITQIGCVWIILVPNTKPCQTRRNSSPSQAGENLEYHVYMRSYPFLCVIPEL